MTKEEKQRLEEIKEDIMLCRNYQEAARDHDVIMSIEKIVILLKRERSTIKLKKPFEV